ncbi:hypothetical protein D5018_10590 [Parashewanella curva]|uniref:Uncharacterized protein n=1 Tax=Parashewanella curva TaxID=2338552 RepID=A0A3L8PWN3_9GAMM|nr:hypothetical protein [Parashewanella curva]RLV59701.1 hypothetical protein D5018_10590 [Parashewanella curva]
MATEITATFSGQHKSVVQTDEAVEPYTSVKLGLRNGFSCYYNVRLDPNFTPAEIACCSAWYSFYSTNGSLPKNPNLNAFECSVEFSNLARAPITSLFQVELRLQPYINIALIKFFNPVSNDLERILTLDFSTSESGLSHLKNIKQLMSELPDHPLLPNKRLDVAIETKSTHTSQFVILGIDDIQVFDFRGLFDARNSITSEEFDRVGYQFNNIWLVDFLEQVCSGLQVFCDKGYDLTQILPSYFGYAPKRSQSILLEWRKISPIKSDVSVGKMDPDKSKQNAVVVFAQLIFILSGKFSKLVSTNMQKTDWTQLGLDISKMKSKVISHLRTSSPNWKKLTKTNDKTPLSPDIRVSGEVSAIDSLLLMVVYMLQPEFLSSVDFEAIKSHLNKIRTKYWV